MAAEMTSRSEDGVDRDVLVWRLARPMLAASTTLVGGGLGVRHWVLNAQVSDDYRRVDVDAHVAQVAAGLGLVGAGVAMLTAARVGHHECVREAGVEVDVTVGLSRPTWAASDEEGTERLGAPGTVNIVAVVPVRLDDGALLNALATATEAKAQALWDAAVPATGTASDAVCVLCPLEGEVARFGGPRSVWGARVARSVHHAVLVGARRWAP